MLYGDEKRREMARSILPSTRRKGARDDKRLNNKRARAKVRAELRRCLFDEDYADEAPDLLYEPSWDYIVRDRQGGDKLNHFMRWAEAITADMPRDSRLAYVRKALPDNLIGWHAVSHLEWRDHFKTQAEIDLWEARRASWRSRRKPKRTREDEVRLLLEIVEDSRLHRLLNRWMQAKHEMVSWCVGYTKPRTVTVTKMGGRRDEVLRVDPIYEKRGPTRAPVLGRPEAFLDACDAGRSVPASVKTPIWLARRIEEAKFFAKENGSWSYRTRHTWTWETERSTQRNPDWHPEWRQALVEFLGTYEEHRHDIYYEDAGFYAFVRALRLWDTFERGRTPNHFARKR